MIRTPAEIVQASFDASSAYDADALHARRTGACILANRKGEAMLRGPAICERPARTVAGNPLNRAWRADRVVVGKHGGGPRDGRARSGDWRI